MPNFHLEHTVRQEAIHLHPWPATYPWQVVPDGEDAIVVDGRRVTYSKERDPAAVGWAALGVEVVLECSGQFLTKAALAPFFGVLPCGLAGIHRFFARFSCRARKPGRRLQEGGGLRRM